MFLKLKDQVQPIFKQARVCTREAQSSGPSSQASVSEFPWEDREVPSYLWAHISEPAPHGPVCCIQANWQGRVETQGTILATESTPAVSRWGSTIQGTRACIILDVNILEGPFGALQWGREGLTAGILRKLLWGTQIPRGSSQTATWGANKRFRSFCSKWWDGERVPAECQGPARPFRD